jgi:hypothetical protein
MNFLSTSLGHLTHFEMSYSLLTPHYNFGDQEAVTQEAVTHFKMSQMTKT